MSNLVGQSIGRYHIVEQLGQGGMATVYKAFDTRLEREVAIKVIRTEAIPANMHSQMLKRFEREAKALAKMEHRFIVNVFDYGEYTDPGETVSAPYLVMEYLPGGTLKERTEQPWSYQDAVKFLLPIAHALEYAHEEGIVHRDVKPANILITRKGDALLSDFGIAKILEGGQATRLTGAGVGIGTPEYMAPEQWTGNVSPQTDIYALAIVLYEMVTGRRPYTADTPAAVLIKQREDPLPHLRQFVPDLPEVVENVLFKALAKKPEDRYASMGEFATALEQIIVRDTAEPIKRVSFVGDSLYPNTNIPIHGPAAVLAVSVPGMQIGDIHVAAPTPIDDLTGDVILQMPLPGSTYPHDAQSRSVTNGVKYMGDSNALQRPYKHVIPRWVWIVGGVGLIVMIVIGGILVAGRTEAGQAAFGVLVATDMLTATRTPVTSATKASTSIPSVTPMPELGIGSTRTSEKDGMVQVYVPAGEFLMGSDDSDNQANDNEKPQHTVYLDAYWIDRMEVTNAQYAKCVAAGACIKPSSLIYYSNSEYQEHPMVYVNWNQTSAYCEWAGRRLPTEAEWEKAARGADSRTYPWGDQGVAGNLLNFADENTDFDWSDKNINDSYADIAPVGSYPDGASPYGALDMAGNVWEWVSDWYDSDYYRNSPTENPTGPSNGTSRVLRGGGFYEDASHVRVANRFGDVSGGLIIFIGFRCAMVSP